MGGQPSTAGMLPPNSSDEEEEEYGGQPSTAGMLPPNSSDEEEEMGQPRKPAAATSGGASSAAAAPVDMAGMTDEMKRLAIVRQRREQQKAERIAKDGFDRYLEPGTPGGPPLQTD